MSRINVANFRHPDGTSDNINLDDSGRVLVGTSSAPTLSAGQYGKIVNIGNTAGSDGDARLVIGRGETASAMSSGDSIGQINFTDSAGADFARIQTFIDGTPGTNDYPGRLGFYTTADGASSLTERMRITSTGDLRFNSGYGSVATAYGCRAWVNFNGTGSVSSNQTINGSGNVSSVYKTGTGLYTVNFANAMPDANYSVVAEAASGSTGNIVGNAPQTTQVNIIAYTSTWSTGDRNPICVAVFR